MRIFFVVIAFVSGTATYAQPIKLEGRYGASFIGGESIEFVGIDSFYFKGFYCTDGVFGKGRCEIRSNYLYLYFEKCDRKEEKEDPARAPVITRINNPDSVVLNIICVDNNNNPIPFGTAMLKSKDRTWIGRMSDSLGRSSFTIKQDDLPLTITTSSVGYETASLSIEEYASFDIRVFHKGYALLKELSNGEVYVYEIEDMSEDLILMRPDRSKERFRRYIRR